MRARTLLVVTAIFSSILGALIVYLFLSVPNDLRADALLKDARKEIEAGKSEDARTTLTKIVQQYPRTDAAAAATVALVSLASKDHDDLALAIRALRKQNDEQAKLISDLQKNVTEIRNAPPKIVTVTAPAKTPPPKKPVPKKRTPTRRRRR
jgi:thioredoxin-like negative regulator of GroEL